MADPSTCPPLTRQSVVEAHERIKPFVHRTPLLTCSTVDRIASTPRTRDELVDLGFEVEDSCELAQPRLRLYFKCENLQKVGAFKARGAFHAIERLKSEMGEGWKETLGKTGVVTHSSGNHAAALALAARTNGIPARIVMPSISPPSKIAATRGYGAEILFSGSTAPERQALCAKVQKETGAVVVPPYDHPDVVLGQGTMGLELCDQAAGLVAAARGEDVASASAAATTAGAAGGNLDAIITPCSGGGMLSGVALSVSNTEKDTGLPVASSAVRVFGAEPSFEGADDLCRSFRSGVRVAKVSSLTIADGLRTPVGDVPWYLIKERGLVENAYAVPELAIKAAVKLVFERMKLVLEPSAAVGLAALLYNEELRRLVESETAASSRAWDVGVIFSGGNCDTARFCELFGDSG